MFDKHLTHFDKLLHTHMNKYSVSTNNITLENNIASITLFWDNIRLMLIIADLSCIQLTLSLAHQSRQM